MKQKEVYICERCKGEGIVYTRVENNIPIPAKPDDGICYRCHGSGIDPKPNAYSKKMMIPVNQTIKEALAMKTTQTNETVNQIIEKKEEEKIMNKTQLRSALKAKGISFTAAEYKAITREEMEALLTPAQEETTPETEVVVPVGDFSSDKLVIHVPAKEIQKSQKELLEQSILNGILRISFEATYNNASVRYVKQKSLFSVILNKISILHHPKYASLTKEQKLQINCNRVEAVITGLVKQGKLAVCRGKDFYALKF